APAPCAPPHLLPPSAVPRPPSAPPFPYTPLFRSLASVALSQRLPRSAHLTTSASLTSELSGGGSIARGEAMLNGGVHRVRSVTLDRKSTRLNSSHVKISYAVFCSKKKTGRSGAGN